MLRSMGESVQYRQRGVGPLSPKGIAFRQVTTATQGKLPMEMTYSTFFESVDRGGLGKFPPHQLLLESAAACHLQSAFCCLHLYYAALIFNKASQHHRKHIG